MANIKTQIPVNSDGLFQKNSKYDSNAKIVKERLNEIVANKLKNNKKTISLNDDFVKQILAYKNRILNLVSKGEKIDIPSRYASFFDSKEIIDAYFLEQENNALELYSVLNSVASILRTGTLENETQYIFYYKLSDGSIISKVISANDITNYYTVQPNAVRTNDFISGDREKLKQDLKETQKIINKNKQMALANYNFSKHYKNFYNAVLDGQRKMNNTQSLNEGFIVEAFEWHLRKVEGHRLTRNKNGLIEDFSYNKEEDDFMWFLRRSKSLFKSCKIAEGQKRYIAGGDVDIYQLKMINFGGSFGVSSRGQLNITANKVISFIDYILSLNNTKIPINEQEIVQMVMFLNDTHEEVGSLIKKDIDKEIEKELTEFFKTYNIVI